MTTTTQSIFDLHTSGYRCVVPVNCVGVAGKGLAKEWKERFPAEYELYQNLCSQAPRPSPGSVTGEGSRTWILAFTKGHWRDPSKKEWVEECLDGIAMFAEVFPLTRIAVPLLGCGCGGLDRKWFLDAARLKLGHHQNITITAR